MSTDYLFEHFRSLPQDEQRQLINHLLDHLYQENEDHDIGLYIDIF
ncbi:hypothetical protein JCM14036_18780 [Desulfotomaculum defluvii]